MTRTFETYQEMLEEFWNVNVTNDSEIQLVRVLTERLIETESIWAPVGLLGGNRGTISNLCEKGVLEQQRKQVRFSHQTVQEFAIARLFEETGKSLSEFVWEHQGAIFSRRTVSAVLSHLRENDREKYHREIDAILSGQARLHVMFLLIDLMCRQPSPTQEEIELVEGFLKHEEWRLRVLIGINNREKWFEALKKTSLPEIMNQPDIEQWPLISVLSNTWSFDWEGTFKLISDCWAKDEKFDNLTLRVMQHCMKWNDEALRLIETVALRVKRNNGHHFQNETLAGVISEVSPADGARLAARIIAQNAPKSESPSYRGSPLEQTKGWYDLEAIATAAPIVFLKEIAPWLQATVETHHSGYSGSVLAHYAGSCMALNDTESPRESSVLASIQASIDLASKSAPREFIQLFKNYWNSENAVLHRLYIDGLMNVVVEFPEDVLDYLAGDDRRFSVGETGDTKDSQSAKLVGLLAPHLSDKKRKQLVQIILNWTKFREGVDLIDDQLVWDRESRLQLLTAIPTQYLSESHIELIEKEKSELPDWDREVRRSHSGWVRTIPPMTQDKMVDAKEDELVDAFAKKKQNGSAWNQVEGGFEEKGGGVAAAEELKKLAESDHQRAGEILRLLAKRRVTSHIGQAIEGLSNCSDHGFVFTLLQDISPQCDESESFRASASRVLLNLCGDDGLPEDINLLLERWLNMPWSYTDSDGDFKEWKPEISLLWHNLGSVFLDTDPSYFVLEALTQSLLARKEPQGDRWINDLSEHLDRDVSAKTWRMFCDRLRYVRANNCSADLGKALVVKLFNKFPNLASETLGCRLLAHLVRFVDGDFLVGILRRLRLSTEQFSQQAAGELLTLSALLDETCEWASPFLESELEKAKHESSPAFLVGCAHAASHLWHDLDEPSECAALMSELFSTGNAEAINAARQLFWIDTSLPGNEETASLFQALTKQIDVVGGGLAGDVLGQMADILPDLRLDILEFCDALVEVRFSELKRREFNAYEAGAYLVEIAMTLQRFPETRIGGLDLFEQLLRAGLDDADKALNDFDGVEESKTPNQRMPRRRRRQQRRRNKKD